MQSLAVALRGYRIHHSAYPGDYVTAFGKALSWRTTVQPLLDGFALTERYGLDEEWDGKNESELAKYPPRSFSCHCGYPFWETACSSSGCYAIVGEETAWSDSEAPHEGQASWLESHRALLIEASPEHVGSWYEAADVSVAQAIDILTRADSELAGGHTVDRGILFAPAKTTHVTFTDGSARRLYCGLTQELARNLVVSTSPLNSRLRRELEAACRPPLDYKVCFAIPMLAALALGPLVVPMLSRGR